MTKQEYEAKVLSLKGTHDYNMLCFIRGEYIASLEAENANLKTEIAQLKKDKLEFNAQCFHKDETISVLKNRITELEFDNRSLVEQMNQMALKQNQEIIDWHNYPEEKPEPNGYMNRVLLVIYQHGITVGIATAEYFFPMFSDMQHELFEFGKLKGVKILAWAYLPKGVTNEHKTN